MTGIGWGKRVNGLRQELTSIRSRAHMDSTRFQELQTQAACCKVQLLAHQLEARRKSLAGDRGFASVGGNGKRLSAALGIAAGASIFTGIMTKDRSAAANAGLSVFDRRMQGLGETDWTVCLGRQLIVAPWADITVGQVWFTWDSVKATLFELEEQAKNGASLGNLDAVISELQKSKRLIMAIKA